MGDSGYESSDSVGEDAELELSCALQDLALRVKTFEENMKGRFLVDGEDSDEVDEIDEDIPELDTQSPSASPSASPKRRRKQEHKQRKRSAKQQDDEEDEDDSYGEDEFADEHEAEAKTPDSRRSKGDDAAAGGWNEQEQKNELSEMQHNIAKLLEGFQEEARALELDNQAK